MGLTQRKIHPDFPLRALIFCADCGTKLTGSWSKGRNKHYAYYRCLSSKCRLPSIPKEELEKDFIRLLDKLKPTPAFVKIFNFVVKDVWNKKFNQVDNNKKNVKKKIEELERRKELLVEKNLEGIYSDELFKDMLSKIEEELLVHKSLINEFEMERINIDTILNFANQLMQNLSDFWIKAEVETERKLCNAIFPKGLIYDGISFGTPTLSPLFALFEEKRTSKSRLGSISERCSKLLYWY